MIINKVKKNKYYGHIANSVQLLQNVKLLKEIQNDRSFTLLLLRCDIFFDVIYCCYCNYLTYLAYLYICLSRSIVFNYRVRCNNN